MVRRDKLNGESGLGGAAQRFLVENVALVLNTSSTHNA